MSIYLEIDYKKILKNTVSERKESDSQFNLTALAQAMGVQKTYVSKVFHHGAELNSDQLFRACRFMEFSESETEYVMLLLEHSHCSFHERKQILFDKIKRIQTTHQQTQSHIRAKPISATTEQHTEYYLDPLTKITHIFLTIPKFAKNPELLAKELQLSPNQIRAILRKLERLGIIEALKSKSEYRVLVNDVHLPKDSPVCTPSQSLLKIKSMQQIQNLPSEKSYTFTVTFTANENARNKIHLGFLEFLKKAETLAKEASGEKVYQLNFDLFPWGRS